MGPLRLSRTVRARPSVRTANLKQSQQIHPSPDPCTTGAEGWRTSHLPASDPLPGRADRHYALLPKLASHSKKQTSIVLFSCALPPWAAAPMPAFWTSALG